MSTDNPRTYGDRDNNTFVETVCDSNGENCNKNTYYWVIEDPGTGGLGGLGGGTGGTGLSTGGKATLYRRNDTFGGQLGDVLIGEKDSTGPNAGKIVHGGTKVNLPGMAVDDDLAHFNKPDTMKRMNGQIDATIKKGMLATKDSNNNDIEPVADSVEEAQKMSNDLRNKGSATNPEDIEDTGTQDTAQISEINPGTRKKFPTLQYPTGIDKNGQDTLKIQMMEYRARKLQSSQGALGPEKRATGNIIGSVTLPIPGNIKDSDKVEWGEDSMNAGELAAAAVGAKFIEGGGGAAGDELRNVLGGFVGYSFAIPSNIVRKIFEDILEYGDVQKGLLGVRGVALKSSYSKQLNLTDTEGFYIDIIEPGFGADLAELKKGDIIKEIDGIKINKFSDLSG